MKYSYRNNVGENRVLPFVHNLCYIKTYVCEHNVLSMRADNIRPYEFVTFTKFVLTYNLYCYLRTNTVRSYD